MLKIKEILENKGSKSSIGGTVSINDIRDKEFSGRKLLPEEEKALRNFDQHRINVLNAQESEEDFHRKFQELQVMANLFPFEEFLKDNLQE